MVNQSSYYDVTISKMSLETQKYLRIFVPGVLILLLGTPLFLESFGITDVKSFLSFENALLVPLAVVLGVFYHVSSVRSFVKQIFTQKTDKKIVDRLLSVSDESIEVRNVAKWCNGKTANSIFYNIVDNDSSLSEKVKIIRFNGVIWTSFIDASTICFLFSGVYLGSYQFVERSHFITLALVLWIASIVCFLLIFPTVNRHLELQDEQIDALIANKKSELLSKLHENL